MRARLGCWRLPEGVGGCVRRGEGVLGEGVQHCTIHSKSILLFVFFVSIYLEM